MEHVVTLTIGISDDDIEREIKSQVVDLASKQIKSNIKEFTTKNYYGDSRLGGIFRDEVKNYIEHHKEEILNLCVDSLVVNMLRTKKVRESIDKSIESFENEKSE